MKKKKVVFSTRSGDLRGQSEASSGPSRSLPPAQQDLRIRRETKGRGGKTVTVISGFVLTDSDLKALAKTLKSSCGAGGTTKLEDDTQIIEIQGDHRDTVVEKLKELGYKAKLAGG